MITLATAGWALPRPVQERFPGDGGQLERYARRMSGIEINSSFHRPHRRTTYQRWADTTPADFRFSVKLPKTISHTAKLRDPDALLDRFFDEAGGLGAKLAVLLLQLPPSFAFDADVVDAFLTNLRQRHAGTVVCEPRHPSWFDAAADERLIAHRIGRVAADPAKVEAAARPGGWQGDDGAGCPGCHYWRWHGAPRVYWSAYDDAWLATRAAEVARLPASADAWCVFDNTASGAALDDALRFEDAIEAISPGRVRRPAAP